MTGGAHEPKRDEEAEAMMTKKPGMLDMTRRTAMKVGAAAALLGGAGPFLLARPNGAWAATLDTVHTEAAAKAKELAQGRTVTLTILQPSGSLGNVKPVADKWTAETGIKVKYLEVPLGEINQKVLLEAVSRTGSFDLALPATFGIPDLAKSGILVNLDQYAQKYEPEDFQKDALYTTGDYYKGSLYGYQTDGDTYVMFYTRSGWRIADEQKAFADKNGYELKVPDTWEAARRHDGVLPPARIRACIGGALFRTQYFIAWEWWGRFHAKGFYPFD